MSAPPAFLHPFTAPARTDFVTIVGGEGAEVVDAEGNRYLDAMASLWYCQIGHGRTEMADAIADQVRTLENFHCFERFTNEPADRFAEEVAATAPFDGARVFLTSSGSEAVDTALKLARLVTGRRGEPERQLVVTREHGYHGVTYGGTSAQGLAANRVGFGPLLEGVVQVAHDDLTEAERLFAERGHEVAAVLAEPVIGAGGVRPVAREYLEGLRRLCDEHGALLIFDEVICGFGRLGQWWGAEHVGVTPDAMTFAKGCTSGYLPLGGVVLGRPLLDHLEDDETFVLRHGHTYSGHPTVCRAGLENLRILRDEALLDRAVHVGRRLGAGLEELADRGLVAEARGDVAIWAVETTPDVSAVAVRDAMLERGVLPRPLGERAVAFCPPLVIADEQVDRCVAALEESLVELGDR